MQVLVLGGKGFIGRHSVQHLKDLGVETTIGTRDVNPEAQIPELRLRLHELTKPKDWLLVVEQFDAVLNCVGILRQRFGETYESVHHLAPSALAQACAQAETRLVHVSALALSPDARSRFITSKYKGEQAIFATNGNWVVARLSLLDGEGGYGAAWLRGVAQLPFFIVPSSARGRIAALTADNAGEALAKLCLWQATESAVVELGGSIGYRFDEYIRGLRKRYADDQALKITIPGLLARFGAHICDVLHFSPFSFGHWELLCYDNLPNRPDLEAILGRSPDQVV